MLCALFVTLIVNFFSYRFFFLFGLKLSIRIVHGNFWIFFFSISVRENIVQNDYLIAFDILPLVLFSLLFITYSTLSVCGLIHDFKVNKANIGSFDSLNQDTGSDCDDNHTASLHK